MTNKEAAVGATKSTTNPIKRLYEWMLGWAETPHGTTALVCISFLESSMFPIPPDVLLIALVLGSPTRWWRLALYCTLASVAGGIVGYGIGVFAWSTLGIWIVESLAHMELTTVDGRPDIALPAILDSLKPTLGGEYLFQLYDKWNAWIVLIFGLTPLPYKLVTVTAGVAKVNLPIFIGASFVSRAIRFFAVAYILRLLGEPAKAFIDKHFNVLSILFVILLIGGFAIIKLLF